MNPKKNQQIDQELPAVEAIVEQAAKEVDAETEAKAPEAQEPKAERIYKLLMKLKEAKAVKDDRAGKKIRRQLRKLGYYISKQPKAE